MNTKRTTQGVRSDEEVKEMTEQGYAGFVPKSTGRSEKLLTPAEETRIQINKSKEAGKEKFIPAEPSEIEKDSDNKEE